MTEAQTDQVVILYHDWMPKADLMQDPELQYLGEWHNNMSVALLPALESTAHGVFNPACFIHTDFSFTSPRIDNVSYADALSNWYTGGPGPKRLVDNCGIMCNPTCPQQSHK